MYIVSRMICDDSAQYHVQDKPRMFVDVEKARQYCKEDLESNFTSRQGYDVDEVVERTGGAKFVTAYFKKIRLNEGMSFVEYRIDHFPASELG